ncbi:MAG: DUF4252 domain-containing protein [Paludibacter sp.]|jgi:hypothetical protein|nr:DUF4252 domain-containing protein [Paludibacter sp.]
MKKIAILIISALIFSQSAAAQDINSIIRKISRADGVERIAIGGFLFAVGKTFLPNEAKNDVMKRISGVEIISSENNADVNVKLIDALKNFSGNKEFDVLVKIKDGDESVLIISEKKKDHIKSLIIIAMEGNELNIVKVKGDIRKSDIEQLMADFDPQKKKK